MIPSQSNFLRPSLIELTHLFMNVSANSYRDEAGRTGAIKDFLNLIFSTTLTWESHQSRFGINPDALDCSDPPFFMVEKNEAGLEGDASLEAALSYAHIATSPAAKVKSFYVLCLCHSFY